MKKERKNSSAPQHKSNPKKSDMLIITICVICLLIIGVITFVFTPNLPTFESTPRTILDPVSALRLESISEPAIVLVEFADFECPYCAQAQSTIESVLLRNEDVILVRRHFPLTSIHPNAYNAAIVTECAQNPNFEKYLYRNQQQLHNLNQLASDFGIDALNCLSQPQFVSIISQDIATANALGVRGTPTYVLLHTNNASEYRFIEGTRSVSEFESIIRSLRIYE